MPEIIVNNLCKRFEYFEKDIGLKASFNNLWKRKKLSKEVLKGISFEVEQGEMVGFLGPNGAGKTTTLKILSGILYPTSGYVNVMGFTPWEREKDFKMNFSIIMGQKSQLWWDLPAIDSLYLNKKIYEIEDKQFNTIFNELVELLGVKDNLKIAVRNLSLGERMKFEIIAALLHKPKVIFLDEPTIGLDLVAQNKIVDFFKYYNEKENITVLLTSHYTKDIEKLCKRTIIINHGQVVYDGNLDQVNGVLCQKKILKIRYSTPLNKELLSGFGEIKEWSDIEAKIIVDKHNVKIVAQQLIMLDSIMDINIEEIQIEDGIIQLYQNK